MSDGREEVFREEQQKKAKAVNIAQTTDSRTDLEGMELGNEGNLDEELGLDMEDEEGSNEDGDEHIRIKADFSEVIAARYRVDGQPDYFNFHTVPLEKLDDNHTTTTVNDYYLQDFEAIPLFGASIRALDKKYAYDLVSAYSKKDHKYTDFAEKYMPRHGTTEGGKGLSLYTHAVIYHSADMSSIVNVNITFGCPSNCSFCKESLLARGFTQMDFEEGTGIIRVKTDEREPFEVPSKVRVKFYDTKQERIVIGPLSVAVVNAFPIATDSLEKLRAGELYRVLAD